MHHHGNNSNSVLTILLLFITNTIFIAVGCFPNIIEYVAQVNDYYVRAMRWVALIRRFHGIPVMQRLFVQEGQPDLPAEEPVQDPPEAEPNNPPEQLIELEQLDPIEAVQLEPNNPPEEE